MPDRAASREGDDPAGAAFGADYAVVILLRRVAVQLNLVGAEFAARSGLHATDLRAIIELLDAERAGVAATPTWLAGQLQLSTASVTALIDRLERAGHVQRFRGEADRRRVRLIVTGSAKQLGEAFFGPLIGQVVGVLSGFGRTERDAITRFLAAVADAAAAGSGGSHDHPVSTPAAAPRLDQQRRARRRSGP
jgi:DNA-binding MarR family transcriptional regulator